MTRGGDTGLALPLLGGHQAKEPSIICTDSTKPEKVDSFMPGDNFSTNLMLSAGNSASLRPWWLMRITLEGKMQSKTRVCTCE